MYVYIIKKIVNSQSCEHNVSTLILKQTNKTKQTDIILHCFFLIAGVRLQYIVQIFIKFLGCILLVSLSLKKRITSLANTLAENSGIIQQSCTEMPSLPLGELSMVLYRRKIWSTSLYVTEDRSVCTCVTKCTWYRNALEYFNVKLITCVLNIFTFFNVILSYCKQ